MLQKLSQNNPTLNHKITYLEIFFDFLINLAHGLISFQRERARFLRNSTHMGTLESRIIGGVGIIGGLEIVINIKNRVGWTGLKK